jgi:hypothetical protein
MKGCAGVQMLDKGIAWRRELLAGSPVQAIASKYRVNSQVVSRAIWLARIPEDLKAIIRQNPEVFTRGSLINGFASKRSQCEKNTFELLRSEILRMVKEGVGSKPKLPKKSSQKKQKKNPVPLIEDETPPVVSVTTNIVEAMTAEKMIKDAIGYRCRVAFSEAGESQVTFNLKSKKDLNTFIDMVTPNIF